MTRKRKLNYPYILNEQKNMLRNPRKFVQNLSSTTTQQFSKRRNRGNAVTPFLLGTAVFIDEHFKQIMIFLLDLYYSTLNDFCLCVHFRNIEI